MLIPRRYGQLTCSKETEWLLTEAGISTVDRTMRELHRVAVDRLISYTKPGGLFRWQVPGVMGKWREPDTLGYLEIDLVSRGGDMAAGEWIRTLCATDLCTGWAERATVVGTGKTRIVTALDRVRPQRPLPLLEMHPDPGSVLRNWHLLRWCHQTGILLSRAQPQHKSDNCHVGYENWTLVPRRIGNQRLDAQLHLDWLDAFYATSSVPTTISSSRW